jgi:hypothetical protein
MQKLFTVENWFYKGVLKMSLSAGMRMKKWFPLGTLFLLAFGALGLGALGPQRVFHKVEREVTQIVSQVEKTVRFDLRSSIQVTPDVDMTTVPQMTPQPASMNGPLRVHPQNPRYFTDHGGRVIYLTGSHTWSNLQDNGGSFPPPPFDYGEYLDFLQTNNHNFFRLWTWEQSRWTVETPDNNYWFDPLPFQRTGPGNALDGRPKFDLSKFNQAYFDRMRERIRLAGERGIYVSIMLFDGWSIEKSKGRFADNNPWRGHPFNSSNNINEIDGDTNNDNSGEETHTLTVPEINAIQEAYIRKVIDTVNDLDNVLYEISNESHNNSEPWQFHLIDFIKNYEAGKPKQHPVGMTATWPGGYNPDLFESAADWISPNNGDGRYLADPPVADGSKVILADTDHLCGVCGDREWVWKSFTRGENVIFMDGYDGAGYGVGGDGFNPNDPTWVSARLNMGYTLRYANRMNLAAMTPQPNLASTGYCLAYPGGTQAQYLVYSPSGGNVTVDLLGASGDLVAEWLNPADGSVHGGGKTIGGGNRTFLPPFGGDAVLYIYSANLPVLGQKFYLPAIRSGEPSRSAALTPAPNLPPSPTPPPTPLQASLRGGAFLETFDGTPGKPQPWSSPFWDIQIHSRDSGSWHTLEPMQAAYGPQCEPPPKTHPTSGAYADSVFQCADRVMTAMNGSNYGVIYLTPNQMINFSSGEAVVQFDLSTLRASSRDWIDLWITPFYENVALPIHSGVDLMGTPNHAVHIFLNVGDAGIFKGEVFREFTSTQLPVNSGLPYERILSPSANTLTTFELRLTGTHVKFGLPEHNLWWIDAVIPDLGWDTGVLQFGHHSYNPAQDCMYSTLACLPNTWHWDNLRINRAVPFIMIKADRRFIDKADPANQTVTFAAPAPKNAYLRFSGVGTIEVSLNGGPFQPAVKARSSELPGMGDYHAEHMSSYWMAVPAGTRTVQFRFSDDGWYTTEYAMIAKDFAIWSLGGN